MNIPSPQYKGHALRAYSQKTFPFYRATALHHTSDQKFDSNERRETDRREMAQFGIGFDGRYYTYKEYRYDLCSDAVNYAQLDRSKPTYRATGSIPPPWKKLEKPTDEEQRLMTELGVTFDGKYYRYGSYRYDRLADALCYAELEQP